MYAAGTVAASGKPCILSGGRDGGFPPCLGAYTSLWVKAYAVAAAREETPSLRKMLLT